GDLKVRGTHFEGSLCGETTQKLVRGRFLRRDWKHKVYEHDPIPRQCEQDQSPAFILWFQIVFRPIEVRQNGVPPAQLESQLSRSIPLRLQPLKARLEESINLLLRLERIRRPNSMTPETTLGWSI